MDLEFTAEERQFRQEARAWLTANVPAEPLPSMDTEDGFRRHQAWEKRLFDARWAVVSWPEEYGGRDAGLTEWLIFEEEYHRAGAPGRVGQNGIFLFAPTLFAFGDTAQRDRYLPAMASGEEIWVQGWSEPEAGSDLANVRSRAVRDDAHGGWRLTGQKIWSSRGTYGHRLFGLFRTDPDSRRHHGLTYFMVDLASPGVTVRPIAQLDGEPGFAEIFLDDVFVPDADVLGAPGEGWTIMIATTGSERGLNLRSPGRFLEPARRLLDLYRRRGGDESLRDAVVRAWMDAEAYRLFTFGTVTKLLDGGRIGADSSVNKVFWSQMDVESHATALRLLGEYGELDAGSPEAVDDARWLDGFLFALGGPIYAGTNEIQRNTIAERVLGLPRAR
ncbi:acyl-CoA dehydrogenase family protein [Yinghuangia sp. ASG 101]|uniref:acyl-CoA dehydrogenase family protein n=1 Tax=Yinghuangia sp. ASG 101 TaxID=2896848 RepID=UPI001E5E2EFD|nr:acyl-CoA dehydrogenase family protein [Yinghuangia sp. ASG 101]UGQ09284.1 acyl-CoA dehydrogenase family protein [Yinghuangia sp. ASG 101]